MPVPKNPLNREQAEKFLTAGPVTAEDKGQHLQLLIIASELINRGIPVHSIYKGY